MGRSFSASTAAILDGNADPELVRRLRDSVCGHPACHELRQARFERMIGVLARRLSSVTVVVENLADTHNCSAVMRSAEGLGIDTIHVVEQPRPFRPHPQILKGAHRWMTVSRHSSIEGCLSTLRENGFTTWAADVGEGCVAVDELDVSTPAAIVLGTEMDGLTEQARTLTDGRFTLPMYGFTGSFNVSVSAAVALTFATAGRRRHLGRSGDLAYPEAERTLTSWLNRESRRRGATRRVAADDLIARHGVPRGVGRAERS